MQDARKNFYRKRLMQEARKVKKIMSKAKNSCNYGKGKFFFFKKKT